MGDNTISSGGYKEAGVDIDAGNALVEAIKPLAAATARPGIIGDLGGFGGLFDPKAAGYDDPILVAATDGVGTKLKIATAANRHDSIGIDLVAMCVNDLVVQGAEPLFFLDYFAAGRLEPAVAEQVVTGIAAGCREAGCALIGGETAEMPGLYAAQDYDLAGFAVGAVERDRLITGDGIAAGDLVLGLLSNGVHANGFSLVRRIVASAALDYGAAAPFDPDRSLAEALLAPTRIYVRACLSAIRAGTVKGLAHITGGGLSENLPRILPPGLGAALTADWPRPPVFDWLETEGELDQAEMLKTFNCGIGMAIVIPATEAAAAAANLRAAGETVVEIGRICEAPNWPQRVRYG